MTRVVAMGTGGPGRGKKKRTILFLSNWDVTGDALPKVILPPPHENKNEFVRNKNRSTRERDAALKFYHGRVKKKIVKITRKRNFFFFYECILAK